MFMRSLCPVLAFIGLAYLISYGLALAIGLTGGSESP
jgi:hypothetical protein